MTESTKLLLAQCRYIRDYDAAAGRKFPEASKIVNRVSARVQARSERGR
jgi:hypothetical protein